MEIVFIVLKNMAGLYAALYARGSQMGVRVPPGVREGISCETGQWEAGRTRPSLGPHGGFSLGMADSEETLRSTRDTLEDYISPWAPGGREDGLKTNMKRDEKRERD
ncbi:hypothetical protein EYF80_046621 [Liparis tanakae]|uniref:Uncharacterized protein n=1 Tax=Liparis tanakae TaxID=230148 RepID=A0A4Z2FQR6_9TELE|nr:hypothetical protein EYF80_046621 [Liparis tanakae]